MAKLNLENATLGVDFFTIEQLEETKRNEVLTNFRQTKLIEFWSSKPIADDSTEEAWEIEFEMLHNKSVLLKELQKENIFFSKNGESFS